MRRIVTISFTGRDAPGGVPRWNRDIRDAFPDREVVHFCWDDLIGHSGIRTDKPEWERARSLNGWLIATKQVRQDDIILVDGFWGIGFLGTKFNVISVAHGNWSHTTKQDVENGIPPEFPQHHAVQVDYRRRHLKNGGKIVAVSNFIAHECKIQWGFEMEVINNGIDTEKFKPAEKKIERKRPIIIHGTTTTNKGFDHIEAVKKLDADVWLLDEAARKLNLPKYDALAQADIVVHPSAHEGNSYFVLETLASGVPIFSYNVGLMFDYFPRHDPFPGEIHHRAYRDPGVTKMCVEAMLIYHKRGTAAWKPRQIAEQHSLDRFCREWREYIERYENALV